MILYHSIQILNHALSPFLRSEYSFCATFGITDTLGQKKFPRKKTQLDLDWYPLHSPFPAMLWDVPILNMYLYLWTCAHSVKVKPNIFFDVQLIDLSFFLYLFLPLSTTVPVCSMYILLYLCTENRKHAIWKWTSARKTLKHLFGNKKTFHSQPYLCIKLGFYYLLWSKSVWMEKNGNDFPF